MPKARNSKVDEALALYRQGLKLIEISRKLDIPEGTVRRWKCTYKWDAPEETERSQPKKPNARKRGGQPGNKNATGPPGNKNAEKFGFLSKYLPEETLELLHLTAGSSPLDLLWTQACWTSHFSPHDSAPLRSSIFSMVLSSASLT